MTTTTNPPQGLSPRPDPRDSPRRLMPAGHVIIVGLVCLIVGSLLNAPGIRKTALGQDVGTKRDVSKFLAEPLYDISHFLHTDRLREEFKDALGRRDDDEVNLALPSPTTVPGTASGTTTTTTAPAKKRAFSPSKPLTTWVGGDSIAITPGESFINQAPSTSVINVAGNVVDGHVATGLARPEVFNWPAHMVDVLNQDNPDALVLTMGSNDDQTLTGDGGVGPFGSDAWQTEYRRRVGGMMDQVTGDGKRVLFWVGIPIMRNLDRSENHYRLMNEIYKSEAEKRPGKVVYIDIYDMFKAPDGGYEDYLGFVQVRTPDGIHFTRAGGDMVAEKVIKAMGSTFDLTSWQKNLPETTTTTAPAGAATTPDSTGPTSTTKARTKKK